MKISLAPIRMDEQIEVSVYGNAIWINGEEFDFSPLPIGAILPVGAVDSKWIVGEVYNNGGQIELTILLPHGPNAPEATRFPAPITVTEDGPIVLPEYDRPEDVEVTDED